ncbi:ATP-dependent zinc protease family protein [Vibrio gangliei]|uniref:ATP-dependent zinc protease family protein n=1 Tax=Vibrio gangliei TaxID=2077090 RepID=UPI000D01E262|nr:ATP-dependent zinc protease [Vibrio gangliei]
MKKWGFFLPALMSVAIVGCSTTPEQTDNSGASQAETTSSATKTEQPKTETKPDSGLSPMEKHPNVKPKPMPTVKPVAKPTDNSVTSGRKSADGKLILGQKEWVHIESLDVNVVARIDTGATTSSVSAIDVVAFERDGKKWVKFKLAHGDRESRELELPVVSTKFIRQSNSDETYERYVVEGWIKVGDLKVKTPFTLADRTHMDYGLLLGRSFFRDVAIVDVSREFVQPKVALDATK